jgi:hypothetical protein
MENNPNANWTAYLTFLQKNVWTSVANRQAFQNNPAGFLAQHPLQFTMPGSTTNPALTVSYQFVFDATDVNGNLTRNIVVPVTPKDVAGTTIADLGTVFGPRALAHW